MEMLQNDQDENYIPPELVNQGTIKRYSDLPTSYPTNINLRKPQPIPSNYNNSYTNQNIPINPNLLKSQESQTQKKEKIVPEEKPIIPDKTISDFFQNEFLADAILKVDENEIKFHKVILSAASEFLYKYFELNKSNEGMQTVEIPEEETIVRKKKRIKFTDYCLMSMIVVLSVVFIMVVLKVM